VSLGVHEQDWRVRGGEGDDDLDGGRAHGVRTRGVWACGVSAHQQALGHHSAHRVSDHHNRGWRGLTETRSTLILTAAV
jgi:hypothetical protein